MRLVCLHTGLGEEGAEAVVGIGLLALIGEMTVGLRTALVPWMLAFRCQSKGATLPPRISSREDRTG